MAQTLFTGIWDAQEQLAFVRDNFPGCAVRRLANYKFEGGGLRSSPSFSGFSMFFFIRSGRPDRDLLGLV